MQVDIMQILIDRIRTTMNFREFKVALNSLCRECAPPPPSLDEAFFVFASKICLPHRSVTSFLRGAPPPKQNPGSAPDLHFGELLLEGV